MEAVQPLPTPPRDSIIVRVKRPTYIVDFRDHQALFRSFADLSFRPEEIRRFANKFGLLSSTGLLGKPAEASGTDFTSVQNWKPEIKRMRNAVTAWERGDAAQTEQALYGGHFGRSYVLVRPSDENGKPELLHCAQTLLDALWLQFAEAVIRNAKLRKCAWCDSWFEYGPGTGKRSTARFCSEKCAEDHYNKTQRRKK